MAYILYSSLGDGRSGGVLPHKEGEHCGNVLQKDVMVLGGGKIAMTNPATLLCIHLPLNKNTKLKLGKPAAINSVSGREFLKCGYVGIYFAEDQALPEDAVEIETDMFMEGVVSGERLPQKPVDLSKIRKKELYF